MKNHTWAKFDSNMDKISSFGEQLLMYSARTLVIVLLFLCVKVSVDKNTDSKLDQLSFLSLSILIADEVSSRIHQTREQKKEIAKLKDEAYNLSLKQGALLIHIALIEDKDTLDSLCIEYTETK